MTDSAPRDAPETPDSGELQPFRYLRECLMIQRGALPRTPLARFWGVSPLHPEARGRFYRAEGELDIARALGEADSPEAQELAEQFGQLKAEVTQAWRRRRAWMLLAASTVLAVFAVVSIATGAR